MRTQNIDIQVLQKALAMFQATTKLTAEVELLQPTFGTKRRPDAMVRIVWRDMEWHFAAEIKNAVTPATLGTVVHLLNQLPEKVLLITKYVTPNVADRLKEMDIPYLDTAGNAYINEPPLFLFIKGNRPPLPHRMERPTRAFQPTGLRVIFALLCNPGLEGAPFRKIKELAKVALGTVNWVMRDLRETGYLIDMGKRGRRLVQKKDLLIRWATNYPEQLRPKLVVGRYRTTDVDWWRHAELQNLQAYWGGEVAAHKLDPYLKPQIVTIYADQPIGELLLTHKMKKDPKGDIQIFKVFWHFEFAWQWHGLDLVPPLLIYADLLATGDPRNIETADTIYGQHLTQLVQEDR
jgi:hypothetical protein